MSTQNVLFLGASRGVGFYTALALLKSGGHATLLLRKPDVFTSNPEYEALSDEEKARVTLVQGDAFVEADVQKAVDAAGEEMNTVVYSIGGTLQYAFPFTFTLIPAQVCARGAAVLLTVLHKLNRAGLRLVVVSAAGNGNSWKDVPLLLKPIYATFIAEAQKDKVALEYLALKASKYPIPPEPPASSLPAEAASLPSDWLDEVVIVHAPVLTDGAETGMLRKASVLPSAYTVSRKDVAKFIVDECLKGTDEWVGDKGVAIAY